MKSLLILAITASALILAVGCTAPQSNSWKPTYSSFDLPAEHPAKENARQFSYDAQGVSLQKVLRLYEGLSGRTVIAGKLPEVTLDLRTAAPLSRIEALQLLDSVLAQHQVAMVLSGEHAVKAVPADKAYLEAPPEITLPWQSLPESSSMMSRTVPVQHFKPSEVLPMLTPLSHCFGGMVALDTQHLLLLRDYSANIRQQLKLLEELERKQASK